MSLIFAPDGVFNSHDLRSPWISLGDEANTLTTLPDTAKNGVNPDWWENLPWSDFYLKLHLTRNIKMFTISLYQLK